jgi:hypothetical protein
MLTIIFQSLRKEPGKRSSANELLVKIKYFEVCSHITTFNFKITLQEHRWVKQYENISNQSFKEWLKVTKMSSF